MQVSIVDVVLKWGKDSFRGLRRPSQPLIIETESHFQAESLDSRLEEEALRSFLSGGTERSRENV